MGLDVYVGRQLQVGWEMWREQLALFCGAKRGYILTSLIQPNMLHNVNLINKVELV
jgi:hypothetical protein